MPDPIAFAQPTNNQIHISPQLALATFQFLQTGEAGFREGGGGLKTGGGGRGRKLPVRAQSMGITEVACAAQFRGMTDGGGVIPPPAHWNWRCLASEYGY